MGNAYQGSFNVFVCPVSGLYAFFFSLTSGTDQSITGYVVVERAQGLTTAAHAYQITNSQSSTAVNVDCLAGDMVWVQMDAGTGFLNGSPTEKVSSFAGYLIQAYPD